ncbi:MAG: hypothetical protein AB1626_04775, partial [Candidatus Micrarchaeota archaeon]
VSTSLELEAARNASKHAPLVFNGPCKRAQEIRAALDAGALVNADSFSELGRIAAAAPGSSIGVRVSLFPSKFGFEPAQLKNAFGRAEELGLKPIALHSHPGTQQKNLAKYAAWLEQYAAEAEKTAECFVLEEISVGGGIPDKLVLSQNNLSVPDYASAVKRAFAETKARLAFEPGRFAAADSMKLLARVQCLKECWGKNYAVCDAGINYLPAITLSQYKISPAKPRGGAKKRFTAAGPLLFANDVLGEVNADLEEGDLLVVENVGAYCTQLAWEMGYGKPKIAETEFE